MNQRLRFGDALDTNCPKCDWTGCNGWLTDHLLTDCPGLAITCPLHSRGVCSSDCLGTLRSFAYVDHIRLFGRKALSRDGSLKNFCDGFFTSVPADRPPSPVFVCASPSSCTSSLDSDDMASPGDSERGISHSPKRQTDVQTVPLPQPLMCRPSMVMMCRPAPPPPPLRTVTPPEMMFSQSSCKRKRPEDQC